MDEVIRDAASGQLPDIEAAISRAGVRDERAHAFCSPRVLRVQNIRNFAMPST
jgi:hypothetical protein